MRLEEEYVGQRKQFIELLGNVAEKLTMNGLTIRGRKIRMPDVEMEYKISHKYEHGENKLAISIEWLDDDSIND